MTTYGTINDLLASPQASFARDSSALMADADGVYREFASGELRRSRAVGAALEGARTNILTRSTEFSNSAWTKARSTVIADDVVSPIEGVLADKVVEDTATNTHAIVQPVAVTSGVIRTFYAIAKGNGRNLRIHASDIAGTTKTASFDLSNGTLIATEGAPIATSILPLAFGFYLVSITVMVGTTGSPNLIFYKMNGSSISYTGDGSSGVWLAHAQAETDSASSPITTAGSAATREADELTLYPSPGTYDVIVIFDDDSTQTFAAQEIDGDGWLVPVGMLNRPIVKSIRHVPAS